MASYAHDEIVPDKQSKAGKKNQVAEMFNSIAGRYDFLNRFLSFGIDKSWRRKAIEQLQKKQPKIILDVATGTGDFAITAYSILKPDRIVGIDISEGMLEAGRKKIGQLNLDKFIELIAGDSEALQFADATFDAVTVAFGVRNFEHLEKGLSEIYRVLKPGGKISIAECTAPRSALIKPFYNLYTFKLVPAFGKLFASNKKAYQYLNNTIQAFPDREKFLDILKKTGFKETYYQSLTLGSCCIYCAEK
jgi:demethylmenaquinone methyltransferase/2-methoxy-6-polyprenyl-1,4-benzoquinol methylase